MKNSICGKIAAGCIGFLSVFLGQQALAHTIAVVEAGGTYELAPGAAQNAYAKAKTCSQIFFKGDGTLMLTGSGGNATVKTTLVATNGTLTVDVSDFAFSSPTYRALHLAGGIDCGTVGTLKIVGATQVKIGDDRESGAVNMPVILPKIELPEGVPLSFAKIAAWSLPDRAKVPWTIADRTEQHLYGDNVFSGLADETGTVLWQNHNSVTICKGSPVGDGGTLDVGSKQIIIYPSYNPTMADSGSINVVDYLSRYGQAMTCNSNLKAERFSCSVRGGTINGSVTCRTMDMQATASGKTKATYVFNAPVEATTVVNVSNSASVGQDFTFNDACFTEGTSLNCVATNAIIRLVKAAEKDYMPVFRELKFTNSLPVYAWHSVLEIGAGLTVKINEVTKGTGILRGQGTVKLGRIRGAATLLVEDGLTVVKDTEVDGAYCVRVDETRIEGKTYTTYFAGNGADGALDLSTYEGSGMVTVSDGTVIYGATNGAPRVTVKVPDGADVSLRSPGDTWRDDVRISHWFDFSDLSTMEQVVATEDPPTTKQATSTVLTGDDLGPKTVSLALLGQNAVAYPAVEKFFDRRGDGFANKLYNNRLTSNAEKTGTNEWWDTVYMVPVTNDTAFGRTYLTSGADRSGRRLSFSPSAYAPKSITLVFGSQYGGGAGLFADNKGTVFGRNPTLDDPILTNDTCDVWVDGVKVDPTTTKFSGGWQVITLQPKYDYRNVSLLAIGYSSAYTGGSMDGGRQNYGEIVIFNAKPTDDERVALEKHLADKWGIDYNLPTAKADLTGTGSATVSGDYELGGDFAGTLTLGATAEVALVGSSSGLTVDGVGELVVPSRAALPTFASTFTGDVRLGPGFAWSFHVNPTAGTVADALNFGQGRLTLPTGTVDVAFDVTGDLNGDNALTLVTAGSLVGAPVWQATVSPDSAAAALRKATFDQSSGSLAVTLASRKGLVLFLR